VSAGGGCNQAHLSVGEGTFAAPVLGRLIGMLAARAGCPIDRLDDALLIADAVAARAGSFSEDGRIGLHVSANRGAVELNIGPLRDDGASALIESAELPGIGNILESVADELSRERGGVHEYLRIRLAFATAVRATDIMSERDAS